MLIDIILSFVLFVYAILAVYFTKYIFQYMRKKHIKEKDAIYYNRKFVHILLGGVIALFMPFYSSPIYPLIAGIILSIITYASHQRGGKMYWFQTNDDKNDVTFCIMWGVSIFALWMLIGNPWVAILPALYMAFGDGITGIIRNATYNKRTKHPIGNIYMALISIPLGYFLGSTAGIALGGVLAGVVATVVERYEFKSIDDNILITFFSTITLYGYFLIHTAFHLSF